MNAIKKYYLRSVFDVKHRKYRYYAGEFIVVDPKTMHQLATCKIYTTKNRTYCCFWLFVNKFTTSGSGYAGGYGYDKTSTAVEKAMNNAGYVFKESIRGSGNALIIEALQIICAFHGYEQVEVYYAHA